ncbi:MAG: LysM peptidoglycan-binding domain-containing M23 family metallopeptidase [Spirochaetales bacterium]|nr:LysM peptidoglycan-binding domain-containing M23 family metallopeptidase [Spirochaetales bacterium]
MYKSVLIQLLFCTLFALPVQGESSAIYHKVRPGENLSRIAGRYRTSVAKIKQWNKLSRNQIQTGRVLKVGEKKKRSSKHASTHATVDQKEERLPATNGPTKLTIAYNYLPPKPRLEEHSDDHFLLHIYAEDFRQSKAAYLEIIPARDSGFKNPSITFYKKKVPLTRTSFGYRGLFGFEPEMKIGLHWLEVSFVAAGKAQIRRYPITVNATSYESYSRRVYLGDWSRPAPEVSPEVAEERRRKAKEREEKIARATAKKNKVFARFSADQFRAELSHPRGQHKITSPFYVNRTIVQYYKKNGKIHYKPPRSVRHRGLDLRGQHGKPIYAVADGTVVIAEDMVFEGNFTVIDHGQGIFTGYMHQSQLLVKEGERIRAGQLIGKSGNTGASAGPHLHLSLLMRGAYLEPLSLLALPIRN